MSRFPLLDTPDWLVSQAPHHTITVMAAMLGCSSATVIKAIRRHGVRGHSLAEAQTKRHSRDREEHWPQLEDRAWFVQKHDTDRLSLKHIAALVGCSIRPVVEARNRYGLTPHASGHRRAPKRRHGRTIPQLEDAAWLKQQLVDRQRDMTDVARELDCTIGTVGRAARRQRIQAVRAGKRCTPLKPWSIPQLLDEAWLRGEYLLKERRAQDIARDLGCTVWAVQGALGRFRLLKYPGRLTTKADPSLPKGVSSRDGYLFEFRPDHPYANGRGNVAQHRMVVEMQLGRLLSPVEEVHHINEKPGDNRPENLLVTPDHSTHMRIHGNQPSWVPRCACCQRPRPELVTGRPSWVPLLYDAAAVYAAGPPPAESKPTPESSADTAAPLATCA